MSEDIFDLTSVEESDFDNSKSWESVDAEHKKLIDKLSSLRIDEIFNKELESINSVSAEDAFEDFLKNREVEFVTVDDMKKHIVLTFNLSQQHKKKMCVIDLDSDLDSNFKLESDESDESEATAECNVSWQEQKGMAIIDLDSELEFVNLVEEPQEPQEEIEHLVI